MCQISAVERAAAGTGLRLDRSTIIGTTLSMASAPDIHDRIARTDDIGALWKLTADHFSSLGFGGVGYMLLKRGQPEEPVAVFGYGLSDELVQGYAALGYGKHDSVLRYGLAKGEPFRRSQLPD